jgi:hypothetical protein
MFAVALNTKTIASPQTAGGQEADPLTITIPQHQAALNTEGYEANEIHSRQTRSTKALQRRLS